MEWLRRRIGRIGPGFITASVVLGPGSIVASSRAGAESGYALIWVIVLAGIFMATYTAMGARLGCRLHEGPLTYVARRGGRPWALLAGAGAFLATVGFQFGGNLGVAIAMQGLFGGPLWPWPPLFTGLALLFFLKARNIYNILEKLMIGLVAVMIFCFLGNLYFTGVDPLGLAAGLVPRLDSAHVTLAAAMLATNFSVLAAFYQAYLVRAKGWGEADVRDAIRDAWVGIAVLVAVVIIILIGAAQTMHGTGETATTAGDLARQFNTLLGPVAKVVFCLGLGAASFSSFIVNAMVGGGMLADGLGWDARVDASPTKRLATACMVIGCLVALAVIALNIDPMLSIIVAQAATLIAVPLAAGILLLLTSSASVMGGLRNRPVVMVVGGLGLAVILLLLTRTVLSMIQTVGGWLG